MEPLFIYGTIFGATLGASGWYTYRWWQRLKHRIVAKAMEESGYKAKESMTALSKIAREAFDPAIKDVVGRLDRIEAKLNRSIRPDRATPSEVTVSPFGVSVGYQVTPAPSVVSVHVDSSLNPNTWNWVTHPGMAALCADLIGALKGLKLPHSTAVKLARSTMDAVAKPGVTLQELLAAATVKPNA